MATQRKYYTLISKGLESYHNGEWVIEFGDYSKSVVIYEMNDYKEEAERNQERVQFKIITTGDQQADVNAAVETLNNKGA